METPHTPPGDQDLLQARMGDCPGADDPAIPSGARGGRPIRRRRRWTRETACAALRAFAVRERRAPRWRDIWSTLELPKGDALFRTLGTYRLQDVWRQAGIPKPLWGLRETHCIACDAAMLVRHGHGVMPRLVCSSCLETRVLQVREARGKGHRGPQVHTVGLPALLRRVLRAAQGNRPR